MTLDCNSTRVQGNSSLSDLHEWLLPWGDAALGLPRREPVLIFTELERPFILLVVFP